MPAESQCNRGDIHPQTGLIFMGLRRYRRPDGTYRIAERWASPAAYEKERGEYKRAANAAYYQANRDRILKKTDQWKKDNRERFRRHKRAYVRRHPEVRIANNSRSRIHRMLGSQGSGRGRSRRLIGCSPDTLRLILEARFEPGMAWANYGSAWHVDHIIPLSAYDLTDQEQQREAFHYTNLQPMWAHENMAKGDDVPGTELVLRLLEAAQKWRSPP